MTTQKLEKKIAQYHDNEWVRLNKNPFKKLLTRLPTDREQGISQSEKIISAKLFYLIVKSGKTSAATAIFQRKHQVDALEQVSWGTLIGT